MFKFNFDKLMPSKKEDELDSKEIEEKKEDEREDAWESLDSENLYNKPGYQDGSEYEKKHPTSKKLELSELSEELEADTESGGGLGELMEKYELEEWELKDRANECLKYYRGEREDPFKDQEKTKEILNWYLDYLSSENEYGLALSNEELERLNKEEKENLSNSYKKRIDIQLDIARLNNSIREAADIIRSGKTSDTYSTEVREAKYNLNKFKEEAKKLYGEMKNNSQKIHNLEEKAFTDPAIKAKKEEAIEAKHEEEKEKRRKIKEEEDYQKKKAEKPFFGPKEHKLHDECLDYLTRDGRKKEVPVYIKDKLTPKQIENTAREAAIDKIYNGEMIKANFFVENFKGKRQLAYAEKFFDEESKKMKRIKYIFADDKLPAGNYGFKINPATMFVSKNNPDSAMVHIDLMVNLDKKSKVDKKTA